MPSFADRIDNVKASTIREILLLTEQKDIISFAGGLPAAELFPVARLREATQRVLSDESRSALQYSTTAGDSRLRHRLAEGGNPDDVLIVSGSQQGLDLTGKLLINRGDGVAVESPTYMGALRALDVYEPEYVVIATDEEGMLPESVERALSAGVRLLYVNPNFANPTGRTMSERRRRMVAELAVQHDCVIYEDDPYGKLRFAGDNLPTIRDFAPDNVVYAGSFSKVLVPGFRLGWMHAPASMREALNRLKQAADLHTSTFVQAVALEVTSPEFMHHHLANVRAHYKRQRDLMLKALDREFGNSLLTTRPEGGMFLWITLPEGVDTEALLPEAVRRGVAYVPGRAFHPENAVPSSPLVHGSNTARLSYSVVSAGEVDKGIATLAEVFDL